MSKRFSILIATLLSFILFNSAQADEKLIKQSLESVGLSDIEISTSPLPGLKTALTSGGVFYVSDDGKHLVRGPLFAVADNGKVTNLSNQLLMDKLHALEANMIVYKAPQEKYVVTVFTDISCAYCHKLHDDIKAYNDLGITIRYLAFPRAGVDSPAGKQMQAIWCSADKIKAYDQVSRGEKLEASCYVGSIANQYKLGMQFGVRGTPALVFSNGELYPGYLPPQELKAELDKRFAIH